MIQKNDKRNTREYGTLGFGDLYYSSLISCSNPYLDTYEFIGLPPLDVLKFAVASLINPSSSLCTFGCSV